MKTIWRVHTGPVNANPYVPHGDGTLMDDCREAYRAEHAPTQHCIPVQFARRSDAQRAVLLMQQRCPCDFDTAVEAAQEIRRVFGSFRKLKRVLIEECCQW